MSQEQSALPALNAVVRDVRAMAVLLRAIAFTPLCQVTISELGIQVITEVNGVLQAVAYLSYKLFAEYEYNAPQQDIDDLLEAHLEGDEQKPTTVFEVSLGDLLVCLNIYGNAGISVSGKSKESDEDIARRKERERMASIKGASLATEMRIVYTGIGSPLILELHEGKTSTRCELATYIANTALITDMIFMDEQVIGQIIMSSKDLTEALQSIDNTAKEVTFIFIDSTRQAIKQDRKISIMSQDVGHMRGGMQSRGTSSIILSTAEDDDDGKYSKQPRNGGDTTTETVQMMRIRSEGVSGSTEVFEKFTCTGDSSTSYQLTDIQRCLKAIQTSLKASLRIDDQGMMNIQCLFPIKADTQYDALTSNSRPDPLNDGFVELKILPVFGEDEG